MPADSQANSSLAERVECLREVLNGTRPGREAMQALAPASILTATPSIVDFCDWSQFNQWPQSQ